MKCAQLGGLHGITERGASAHHDYGQCRVALRDAGKDGHAIIARQDQVEQNDVGLVVLHFGQAGIAVRRSGDAVPFRLQQSGQHAPDVGFIVNDQDCGAHGVSEIRSTPT